MSRAVKVLLVDGGATRDDAVATLQSGGFKVTSAGSFGQAMDLVLSEPPDVLVTELRLGAFNGLHLIMRLRSHLPDARAVVFTAFPDPVLQKQAHQMGADFLVNHGDASHLVALLTSHMKSPEGQELIDTVESVVRR